MIKILLQSGSFAHYGVSKLDGAPGRGSGRYELDSGKNPRASKLRGSMLSPALAKADGKNPSTKSQMLNDLSSMDPKRKAGYLRSMAKDLIDGKIGCGAAGELAKKQKEYCQEQVDSLAATTGGNFNNVYKDFEISEGGSVYRVADIGDDSREGRKYVTGIKTLEEIYIRNYEDGGLGSDDYKAEGRVYEIKPKHPIKIAGYEKTISAVADELFGDKTIDEVFLENSTADNNPVTAERLYELYVKWASPISSAYDRAPFYKKPWFNSPKDEYKSIKDIKIKDMAKFLYSKEGELFRTATGECHDREFKKEKDPDVYSLFNVFSAVTDAITVRANDEIMNYKAGSSTNDFYKRISDRLQSEGYSGMIDIEDCYMAVTPMILFNVDKSGYNTAPVMDKNGTKERVVKKH